MESFLIFFAVFAFIIFPVSFLVFHLLTRKYLNPYKLIFVFAKKGQGKSTYLTKQALKHLKLGWSVYSTEPIPGCYKIQPEDIGKYEFPRRSLLIIDEVGMIWDNRDFKNFSTATRDWFKLQRHRGIKVICASQSFDVDKKIRDLADDMFLLTKKLRVFSYGKRILKILDIVEADGSHNSESRIVNQLQFDSLFFFWAGSRSLTFIPHWTRYFDTNAAPALQLKSWEKIPPLDKDRRERKRLACMPGRAFLASSIVALRSFLSRVFHR